MTTNVAISLGQSLGRVTIPLDESKLQGGDFMRVRDVVNIVEALCRGQRVTFNNDSRVGFYFDMSDCPIFAFGVDI